ncbi:geranylgeranyl reductase family protein [Microbacterium candidum]|uniref:Geranylgeranyl reductase family protein n=1 Tax=Microbacterium candidum TaxID=3041922 RepID=A0ABT7N2L7_9MICO|nr:geranylgeranyl reductase family protein [Microbacterium sp. ASV49]MDL9980950.1 geranylgeranyl reductase family protein [Microbacterium sp. ASV49]
MTSVSGEWDVIVVGAGPAGSTAARVAAASGARTLLIDRATFPRYKTCGGGLIGASRALLPPAAAATIERQVDEVVFTLQGARPVRVKRDAAFLAMTRRETFDAALLAEAQAAGAEFVGGAALRDLTVSGDVVTVVTSAGDATARCVIGADGVGGRVGRYVGVIPERIDLGLEDELDASGRPEVLLDWGPGAGSYAWTFPKASVDTVGVIEAKGHADRTRAYLADWRTQQDDPDAAVVHSSGHLTQWRRTDSPLRRGPVLVAGDAAGLLEPWTREGISFALRSGALAGEAAAAYVSTGADLDAYAAAVDRTLVPEMRVGALLLAVFEKHPRLVHRLATRSRRAQRYFVEFCAGERSLADLGRRPWILRMLRSLA